MEIVLEPYQELHAQNIEKIYQTQVFYLDTTPMGVGKTEPALWAAKRFFGSILVIAPKVVKGFWRKKCEQYGIECLGVINYETLRSVTGHQPKHGLLTRHDVEGEVYFTPNQKLIDILNEGTLIVMDEIQMVKNDNDQFKACMAITHSVGKYGNSRMAFLSATPYDREDCVLQFLRLTNIVHSEKLGGRRGSDGLEQLIAHAREINLGVTNDILTKFQYDKTEILNKAITTALCYRLYSDVIKPLVNIAMPPLKIDAQKYMINGFFKISPEAERDLRLKIDELATLVEYDPVAKTINTKKRRFFAGFTKTMMIIEMMKVPIIVREAIDRLTSTPGSKVVIGMNYNESIDRVLQELRDYQPLLLRGETKEADRERNIDLFQNDPDYRILVCNIKVGNVGITLNDIRGDAPRFMLVVPLPSTISLYQFVYRVWRFRTKSDVDVVIVYVNGGEAEMKIYDIIARKSEIVKESIVDSVAEQLVFPGDFPMIEIDQHNRKVMPKREVAAAERMVIPPSRHERAAAAARSAKAVSKLAASIGGMGFRPKSPESPRRGPPRVPQPIAGPRSAPSRAVTVSRPLTREQITELRSRRIEKYE